MILNIVWRKQFVLFTNINAFLKSPFFNKKTFILIKQHHVHVGCMCWPNFRIAIAQQSLFLFSYLWSNTFSHNVFCFSWNAYVFWLSNVFALFSFIFKVSSYWRLATLRFWVVWIVSTTIRYYNICVRGVNALCSCLNLYWNGIMRKSK